VTASVRAPVPLLLLAAVLGACAATGGEGDRGHPAPPPVAGRPAPSPAPPVPARDDERWTGLVVEPVTEGLARALGLRRVEGLYVRAVEPESPGARAGAQVGDVVLMAAGRYVADPGAVARALGGVAVGETARVAVRRGDALLLLALPVERSPAGRLLVVIDGPAGILGVAADGALLWAFGPMPGASDRGFLPIQLPDGPPPPVPPRPVASGGAERVIAADGERVYLGWAGSELHIDVYELASGRVGQIPVRGAESLAHRCRPRGLARVRGEVWLACSRAEGPVVAAIDLASGQARIEPLPPDYAAGLAFDGEAVLWLCCGAGGQISLVRRELGTGVTRRFPLPRPAMGVAADGRAVYLLGADGRIYAHRPWR
jgi:hypothetical protein